MTKVREEVLLYYYGGVILKIKEFICTKCDTELKALNIISYTCPHCGSELKPINQQIEEQLEEYSKKITPDVIEELKNEESKLDDFLNKPIIRDIKDKVKYIYNYIISSDVVFEKKVYAAASILYLFSPIDLIPDIIPILGFTDDMGVILLVYSMLSKEFDQKNIKKVRNYQTTNTIFHIVGKSNNLVFNYDEEKLRRVWTLSVDKAKHLGYKVIGSSLMKAPETYILHPYLPDTLVPINNYDQILSESIIREQFNLASMLGAKSIKFTVKEEENRISKRKINVKRNSVDTIGEQEKHTVEYKEKIYFDEFNSFDEIHTDLTNKLVWYYTNESFVKDLIPQRLLNDVKTKSFQYSFNTSHLLSHEARLNLTKKMPFGIKSKFSNSLKHSINIDIEFFDLPKHIKDRKHETYKKMIDSISRREREVVDVVQFK